MNKTSIFQKEELLVKKEKKCKEDLRLSNLVLLVSKEQT